MAEYTTISLRKEFVADVESYIDEEPFGSVKEFLKHLAIREMAAEDTISETEAREIGQKLRDLGYVE
jgi:Arc/MetJ-type ribon-helix-helix transcriptional regulator